MRIFHKILLRFFLILSPARKIWKHSGNFDVSYLNRAIYKVYMGPLFLHDLLFPSKRIMYVVGCNINGMVCATIGPIHLWNRICIPLWFHEIFSTVNWFYFSYISLAKWRLWWQTVEIICREKFQSIKFFVKLQSNHHKFIQIGHVRDS